MKWWIKWCYSNFYEVRELDHNWETYYFLRFYDNYWEAWGACCRCQGKEWDDPLVQELRGIPIKIEGIRK